MKLPWESAIDGLFDVLGQAITDKDLLAKLETKRFELTTAISSELLKTKTIPWVDALVKIMIAMKDIIIPLFRPLIGAAMTAFGMYMHYRGTPMDAATQIIFDGAAPAWGVSRHANKQKEQQTKQVEAEYAEWGWEEEEGYDS